MMVMMMALKKHSANSLPLIIIVNITNEIGMTIIIAFSLRLVLQCRDGDDDGVEETFWRTREGLEQLTATVL